MKLSMVRTDDQELFIDVHICFFKQVEEKDNQRFSESRLAEELSFRIYDNKRDIIVQLTDVERGWELKRKDSMQMRNSILGISIETSQLTSINPK